jgi:D-sedoheptulose 7-phosphate isomerase
VALEAEFEDQGPASAQSGHAAAYLVGLAEIVSGIDPTSVAAAAEVLLEAWESDHNVLIVGNGGSASTASHMACDLSKQTMVPGRRPLRALALTDNMSLVSAWGNDSDFSRVFAEQVHIHGRPGDVLLCISCSGNSFNVLAAIDEARSLNMKVIALGGFGGGSMRELADVYVHVPSDDYGHVESAHIAIEHCLTDMVTRYARTEVMPAAANPAPVVMIDRDGVINHNLPGGVRSWREFEFLPGALEGLAALKSHGFRVVVITNQANVARGKMTPAQLRDIHLRMSNAVIARGGEIEAIYVCEHDPSDGCDCRKPAPGLLERAAQDLQFSLGEAFFIGDHRNDIEAGWAAGARPVLVLSGRGDETDAAGFECPVVSDLEAAAEFVLHAMERPANLLSVEASKA